MPRARKRRIFLEPPRLKFDFIRQKAEEFRRNYVKPIDLVPVPIIEIGTYQSQRTSMVLTMNPRLSYIYRQITMGGYPKGGTSPHSLDS